MSTTTSSRDGIGTPTRTTSTSIKTTCCRKPTVPSTALVEDLDERVAETTLVIGVGEFGRTPLINKFAGRDHWPDCYSVVLAGGGVVGGAVYGVSTDRPIRPPTRFRRPTWRRPSSGGSASIRRPRSTTFPGGPSRSPKATPSGAIQRRGVRRLFVVLRLAGRLRLFFGRGFFLRGPTSASA